MESGIHACPSIWLEAVSDMIRLSSSEVVLSMTREMMTIPIRLKAKRAAANLPPSWVTSNSIIGILAVDQDPRKIKTLNRETPFLRKTAATGNAAYKGPAEKAPRINANKEPLMPASLPMYRIIVSFGTQTSISPRRMKIGVNYKE